MSLRLGYLNLTNFFLSNTADLDWEEFNERGLALARRLQKPLQYHTNEPCELSTLGISQDLQDKFTRWQGKFRTQNSPQARKEQHKEGFKLAQRLKNELQDKAYVEFEGAHRCILCERKP